MRTVESYYVLPLYTAFIIPYVLGGADEIYSDRRWHGWSKLTTREFRRDRH